MPGMQVPMRAQLGRARSALFSRVNIKEKKMISFQLNRNCAINIRLVFKLFNKWAKFGMNKNI